MFLYSDSVGICVDFVAAGVYGVDRWDGHEVDGCNQSKNSMLKSDYKANVFFFFLWKGFFHFVWSEANIRLKKKSSNFVGFIDDMTFVRLKDDYYKNGIANCN